MNVMARAWEIAREGQRRFGGKVKEYFAQALVLAWKLYKSIPKRAAEGFLYMGMNKGQHIVMVNDDNMLCVQTVTKYHVTTKPSMRGNRNGVRMRAYAITEGETVEFYRKVENMKYTERLTIVNNELIWS
jgi:hypothetical protein